MNTGIYEIVNLTNGKRYVGSAVNFKRRWYMHRWELRRGEHRNTHLQATWDKHGEDKFGFRPLLACDRHNLVMYEQIAIDALRPEYNICKVAASTIGFRFSEESRAKLSHRARAENLSPETRARMSASQAKRTHPPETRAKISAIVRGRKESDETRARKSASLLGHSVSEETRAKLRAARLGQRHSPESKAKIAAASTGRKHTPEAKAKIAAAKLGKPGWSRGLKRGPLSADARVKISAARRAHEATRRAAKA